MRNNWDWEEIKGAPLGWSGPERTLPSPKFPRVWLRQGLIAAVLFLVITFIFRFDGLGARKLQLGLRHYLTEPAADYTAVLADTVRSAMWLDTYNRWVFHSFNPEPVAVPASTTPATPLMALPLSGNISRPYGPVVVNEQQYFHQGIDIQAPGGTAVQAVLTGRVIRTGDDPALGRVVEIEHGQGLITVYGTLGQVKVNKNQVVERGTVIAILAASKAAQLHFEVRQNGQAVDPTSYLTTPGKL